MTDPFERAVERLEQQRRRRVSRHVEAGFRHHLRAYVMVNVLLVVIWLVTTGPGSHPWPVYPLLGWGIGLSFHWSAYRDRLRRDADLAPGRDAD